VRAVMGGDAGGDAFLRFNRDGERGLVAGVILRRHHGELELIGALLVMARQMRPRPNGP